MKLKKNYSHMYPMSQDFIRMAVSIGSSGFSGGGFRAVFTEQNRQPRVQVSPINIIVANKGNLRNKNRLTKNSFILISIFSSEISDIVQKFYRADVLGTFDNMIFFLQKSTSSDFS